MTQGKKLLALLLTFAMLLSTLTCAMLVPASAAETDVWDGTVADAYAGGSGTADDPYLIANGEQLARMIGYDVLTNFEGTTGIVNGSVGKYYKLTADIYLNDISTDNWYEGEELNGWYNSNSSRFCGNLDGDGHTVYGLWFEDGASCAGLIPSFDSWESDRTIKNLNVSHSYIKGVYAGGIVGRCYGNNTKTVYFQNCYVDDSVIVEGTSTGTNNTYPFEAGFVGYSTNGAKTIYIFTNSASLAKSAEGSYLKYGFIGLNATWNMTLYYTITNSFAYAESWQGVTASATVTNSYLVTDLATITGDAAKTAMPDLDWDKWATVANDYPILSTAIDFNGKVGEVWNGYVAEEYAGGSGTAADPYIIETPNQLARMVKNDIIDTAANNASFSMGKYYKLAADIYLNDVSDPDWRENDPNMWYGSASNQRFGGNIDGDGYTVYGLYYEGSDSGAGLIPYADIYSYDITIKDLIISDAYFNTSGAFVGSIIGYVYGTATTGRALTISGCFVDDNVYITSTNSYPYIGGIVGTLRGNSYNKYNFIGSASLADVRCTLDNGWKRYGGLVGPVGNGIFTIDNCFAFPVLGITSSAASITGTNSFAVSSHEALLTIQGENAVETMVDFDWANGAFAPVNEGYPRLKAVSEKMGDVNGDNLSNSADLAQLRKHFIGTEASYVYDMNSDGDSDVRDLVNLKKKVANAEIADSYVPEGYSLVWNDEFYGRTIDGSKWRTDQARMHGTDELFNADDSTVRTVDNGDMVLTAYKNTDTEGYGGKAYVTTNSITTENRMSYRYGYLEVRARVPYKEGCWPALWLRSPNASGNEGTDGYEMEVDIIEVFGATDKNKVTIHETNKEDDTDHTQDAGQYYTFENAENLANEYHTYGFLWTADVMTFFIDGAQIASYTKAQLAELGYSSSFDDTVNILFNNHLFTKSSENKVGGEDNIIENHEENLPAKFEIDYVRLYQAEDDASLLVIEDVVE